MIRMHCNREVTRLPDNGTHIRRMCTVCDKKFEQRITSTDWRKMHRDNKLLSLVLIDLNTGKPIEL